MNTKTKVGIGILIAGCAFVIGWDIYNNVTSGNNNTDTNNDNTVDTGTLYTNPYTANLNSTDQAAILAAANALGVPVDWISALLFDESGITPNIQAGQRAGAPFNPNLATGVMQWEPATAKGLGTSTAALYAMSIAQQMPYVVEFFQEVPGDVSTYGNLYLKVLSPALASQNLPDTYVAPSDTTADNAPLFAPDNTLGSFKTNVTNRAQQHGFSV